MSKYNDKELHLCDFCSEVIICRFKDVNKVLDCMVEYKMVDLKFSKTQSKKVIVVKDCLNYKKAHREGQYEAN